MSAYEFGTCSFCGAGNGLLGEMGSDIAQYIYMPEHPNSSEQGYVWWCAQCDEGLEYRYREYDNPTLESMWEKGKKILEDNPIRYEPPYDDQMTHIKKIRLSDEVWHMARELDRRDWNDQ